MGISLEFLESEEWKTIQDELDKLEKSGVQLSPSRDKLFTSLSEFDLGSVDVCLVGQDPYPNPKLSTGRAFSIPKRFSPEDFPPTLKQIFKEYCKDLHFPFPSHGDLSKWRDQGVLLWNYVPVTQAFTSLTCDWLQWDSLNRELMEKLKDNKVVFALLGGTAKRSLKYIGEDYPYVVVTSHPSPRGSLRSKNPFIGARLFSSINVKLRQLGKEPIDWRLE